MVVPYDSKTTVGYRPLPLDKKKLRDLLRVIAKGDANATQKHAFQEMQVRSLPRPPPPHTRMPWVSEGPPQAVLCAVGLFVRVTVHAVAHALAQS